MHTIPKETDPRTFIAELVRVVDQIVENLGHEGEPSQLQEWKSFQKALQSSVDAIPCLPESLKITVPLVYRPTNDVHSTENPDLRDQELGADAVSIDTSAAQNETVAGSHGESTRPPAEPTRNFDDTDKKARAVLQDENKPAQENLLKIDWIPTQGNMFVLLSNASLQDRLKARFSVDFFAVAQNRWCSMNGIINVLQLTSKIYKRPDGRMCIFLLSDEDHNFLYSRSNSYVALCAGSEDLTFLIPFKIFDICLNSMKKSLDEHDNCWLVDLTVQGNQFFLEQTNRSPFDVTEFKFYGN